MLEDLPRKHHRSTRDLGFLNRKCLLYQQPSSINNRGCENGVHAASTATCGSSPETHATFCHQVPVLHMYWCNYIFHTCKCTHMHAHDDILCTCTHVSSCTITQNKTKQTWTAPIYLWHASRQFSHVIFKKSVHTPTDRTLLL